MIRKRICYINHVAEIGGAEKSLLSHLRHLDRTKCDPTLVCSTGPLVDGAKSFKWWIKWKIKSTSVIVAASESIKLHIEKTLNSSVICEYIPNGIDLPQEEPPFPVADRLNICMIAHLVPWKREFVVKRSN